MEFLGTDDGSMCPECAALDGVILKIEEAHGVIPMHPGCRCSWTAANVGEDDEKASGRSGGQIDTRKGIDAAFDDAGIDDKTVSKDRPQSILNQSSHDGSWQAGTLSALDLFSEVLFNVFCATGEGGGVDPTCSPGSIAKTPPTAITKIRRTILKSYL